MHKIISLLSIFVLILVGCSATNQNPCDQYDAKIGFVTGVGGINDKSFTQGAWEGIQKYCSENQVGAKYVESNDEAELVPNLEEMSKYEVVVATGYIFESPIYDVAISNPETHYILIDAVPMNPKTGEYVELDNVTSFLFSEEEAGYLVGYVAGLVTETNKIGFIGGMAVPPVEKFGAGYIQGATDANDLVEIEYAYIESFTDTTKAQTMASTMYQSGVDIIFTAAGGAGMGVIEEAKKLKLAEENVWVIGVDSDQYDDGIYNDQKDSVILTSAFKAVENAAYIGLEEYFNNTIKPGTIVLTISDQAVRLPSSNPNLNDEILSEIKNIEKEISDNKINIISDPEEVAKQSNVNGL